MLIEFAGLPGSGKTTVTKLLAQRFIDANIGVESAEEIAKQAPAEVKLPRYLRAHPDRLLLHRYVRFKRRNPRIDELVLEAFETAPIRHLLFTLMAASHQGARDNENPRKIALQDEGFVSHAVAMFWSHPAPDRFREFVDLAPLPDFLVILDLDAQIAFDRVVARNDAAQSDGESELRTLKKFGGPKEFGKRRDMFRMATEAYAARSGTTLIFDPETQRADEICSQIYEEVVSRRSKRVAG